MKDLIFKGVQDLEMQKRIEIFHSEAIERLNSNFDSKILYGVDITLNNRMRSVSGRAKGKIYINLNYRLFKKEENYDYLRQTYLHELAHLICHRKYKCKKGHGKEWKSVMKILGADPKRCHKMDVSELRIKRKRFSYKCSCREIDVSLIRHNKIKKGKKYICTICGSDIVEVVC